MPAAHYIKRQKQRDRVENLSPRFFECLRDGHTVGDSCKAAGIPIATVYEWSRIAREEEYASDEIINFHFDFIDAKADGRYKLLKQMGKPAIKKKKDANGKTILVEKRTNPTAVAHRILTRWEYQVNNYEEEPEDNPLVQLMGVTLKKDGRS